MTRTMRRPRFVVAAAMAVTAAFLATSPAGHTGVATETASGSKAVRPPDIVLFLTDDMRYDMLAPPQPGLPPPMQSVTHTLVDHGVTFTNGFVVNSLCCPSRSSILTGNYSHTTKVYLNSGEFGGYQAFDPTTTVATALNGAGYRTALFGKYLNGYDGATIPPGWTDWSVFSNAGSEGGAYYNYTLNTDGTLVPYGNAPEDYSTDVLARQASRFIRSAGGPLFLYFSPFGPHLPATPAPRDATAYGRLDPYRPPSYDEEDVQDKPQWVQNVPPLDDRKKRKIDKIRKNMYRTLLSEDDAFNSLIQALKDTGRLSNTLILFASDNGSQWGEHRLSGKQTPYEESIRVPVVVRYDPLTAATSPFTDNHLVLNIDFAPTFVDLVDDYVPGLSLQTEGTSLLPLIQQSATDWRTSFLVEHLNGGAKDDIPTYCQTHDERYSYVKYEGPKTGTDTGVDYELYDLQADPYELQNVADDPAYADVRSTMQSRLEALCQPPPPDGYVP